VGHRAVGLDQRQVVRASRAHQREVAGPEQERQRLHDQHEDVADHHQPSLEPAAQVARRQRQQRLHHQGNPQAAEQQRDGVGQRHLGEPPGEQIERAADRDAQQRDPSCPAPRQHPQPRADEAGRDDQLERQRRRLLSVERARRRQRERANPQRDGRQRDSREHARRASYGHQELPRRTIAGPPPGIKAECVRHAASSAQSAGSSRTTGITLLSARLR
jgi:hypothetical protein